MKKVLKIIGKLIVVLVILIVLVVIGGRAINGQKSKIASKAGVQESVTIEINGIKQELSIRGEDINNPVILFLHGGPGSPVGYFDYIWQPELNKDFTIVTYDQRGCGRAYYANPEAVVSKELILEDVDAIVSYLQARFGQEKVIIMGHSWGTILGTTYTYNHPDKVSNYIGIGQVVNIYEGEELAFKEATQRAKEHNDLEYVEAFTENYEVFCEEGAINEAFVNYRGMAPKYLKGKNEKSIPQLAPAYLTSPTLNGADIKWFWSDSDKALLDERNTLTKSLFEFDANEMLEYEVPMYFISGDSDYVTPFALAEAYCEKITAPAKQMSMIEGVGHNVYLDAPTQFAEEVKRLMMVQ